jgi:G:T-mismatch repair DNA endonuclease (very short patch repair protein)
MEKCKYCNKKFNSQQSVLGHIAHCDDFKNWKDRVITYDFLYEEYINKGKSALEIAQNLGFPSSAIINKRLTQLHIPKRGISESRKMKRCKEKAAKTNIEKYGAFNVFCRESSNRKEWEQRIFDEEGITNVFQREDIIKKISNNSIQRFTKIHKIVLNYLKEIGYECKIEHSISEYLPGYKRKQFRFYDICIESIKTIIEVNGNYWHANPKKYKSSDILNMRSGKFKQAQEIWDRDNEKRQMAINKGYEVIVLWETEVNNGEFKEELWKLLKLKK